MAGSPRYLRYILLSLFTIALVFLISSSSTQNAAIDRIHSAKELVKLQLQHAGEWWGRAGKQEATSSFADDEYSPENKPQKDQIVADGQEKVIAPVAGSSPNPLSGSSIIKQPIGERVNATFVTLARNGDVWDIARSIRQVEDRFNRNYHYDWVFLNDAEFDEQFKSVTSRLVSGRARYGKIGEEHWGFPDFIDKEKAAAVREEMAAKKIIYGDSISYRHMCRYESGFFFRHPLMLEYEWYWRVEPSIELFCDVAFDPFRYMQEHNKKYSFVLSLYEYVETIPTLWDSVKKFMKEHPEHIAQDNSMEFLSDDGGETYNHCHFWSNFEVGSLEWLRSPAYLDYFSSLDHDGGFFYERWGDAPVHSIAAALMLPKEEIHFFNEIAYYHVPFTHCPTGEKLRLDLRCHCNPSDNFDWNGYSCECNMCPLYRSFPGMLT